MTAFARLDQVMLVEFGRRFVKCLTSQMPASDWVFYEINSELRIVRFLSTQTDSDQHRAYLRYFNQLDPLAPRNCLPRQRYVASLRQTLSSQSHAHNQYRRHFMERYAIGDALEIFMRAGQHGFVGCSLLRSAALPPYSERELHAGERLQDFAEFSLAQIHSAPAFDAVSIAGRFPELTPREVDMVFLVCEGLSNKAICRREDLALPTVKSHLMNVFRKLGVCSRIELINLVR